MPKTHSKGQFKPAKFLTTKNLFEFVVKSHRREKSLTTKNAKNAQPIVAVSSTQLESKPQVEIDANLPAITMTGAQRNAQRSATKTLRYI